MLWVAAPCNTINSSSSSSTYVERSSSIIDLAWCSSDFLEYVHDFEVTNLALSDHLPCLVSLSLITPVEQPVQRQSRIRVDKDSAELLYNHMLTMSAMSNIDDPKQFIVNSCDQLGLRKSNQMHFSKPWYDYDCVRALNYVSFKYCMFKSFPSDITRSELVISRKQYFRTVKEKKRLYNEHLQEILADCNSRSSFWNTIRKFRRNGGESCPICTIAWEYFYDLELPLRTEAEVVDVLPRCNVSSLDQPFTPEELYLALLNCNPKPQALIVSRTPYYGVCRQKFCLLC